MGHPADSLPNRRPTAEHRRAERVFRAQLSLAGIAPFDRIVYGPGLIVCFWTPKKQMVLVDITGRRLRLPDGTLRTMPDLRKALA